MHFKQEEALTKIQRLKSSDFSHKKNKISLISNYTSNETARFKPSMRLQCLTPRLDMENMGFISMESISSEDEEETNLPTE